MHKKSPEHVQVFNSLIIPKIYKNIPHYQKMLCDLLRFLLYITNLHGIVNLYAFTNVIVSELMNGGYMRKIIMLSVGAFVALFFNISMADDRIYCKKDMGNACPSKCSCNLETMLCVSAADAKTPCALPNPSSLLNY